MDASETRTWRSPMRAPARRRSGPNGPPAIVLVLALVGCSAASVQRTASPTADGLCLDGLFVRPHAGNLRDVLERRYRHRTPAWFDLRTSGPLVLIDGVQVDGLQRLAGLEAADVANVETLEAARAMPEFGARAREGAVVVVTNRGLAAGTDMRPGARPVMPCRGRSG